jgi:adenylosuccinate synthase
VTRVGEEGERREVAEEKTARLSGTEAEPHAVTGRRRRGSNEQLKLDSINPR